MSFKLGLLTTYFKKSVKKSDKNVSKRAKKQLIVNCDPEGQRVDGLREANTRVKVIL